MRHLWSAATWELQVDDDSHEESMIQIPVSILNLDIEEKYLVSHSPIQVYGVPLSSTLHLLTAWYVHDFLDKLHISLFDPNGRELWYSEPKRKLGGISTRAVHVIPIRNLRYSVDGLYEFAFYFSNDDGGHSETGSFRVAMNKTWRS